MSNKQAQHKAEQVRLRHILLVMANGDVVPMDLAKVAIVDKASGKPLFKDQTKEKK